MKALSCVGKIALAVGLLLAGSWGAHAADRFSLAVGSHDILTVSNNAGAQKAALPLPTISQSVTVGDVVFQVSYGRDANDLLTAILSPDPNQPQDLHFKVLGKEIDSDRQAVVTLTFSKELKSVKIDPGYIGAVEVNAQRLQPDSALNRPMQRADVAITPDASGNPLTQSADRSDAPSSAVAAASTSIVPATAPEAPPISLPVPDPTASVAANQSANVTDPSEAAQGRVSDHAPLPMEVNDASQMPFTATATPGPSTVSVSGSQTAPRQHSLYWAEPITAPDGSHPACASDQMKLVDLKGSVSVTPPSGQSTNGQDGMVVPSGSTVATSGGSSVALFMGGVNSVRLMPDTEVQITQDLKGSVRETVIALHQGTIFNRVGRAAGETENYQVQSPEGVAVAKGTEFADSLANGHHYAFVVKGIVWTFINGIQTGNLTPTSTHLAFGSMPPSSDGDKVLFAILNALQPFQSNLQQVIAHINNHTATPQELGYFDSIRNTFAVAVDDVYDPTHPNSFLGAFTSTTGFGDSFHSSLERPQDFANPNPLNTFNGLIPPTGNQFAPTFSAPATPATQVIFSTSAVSAINGDGLPVNQPPS